MEFSHIPVLLEQAVDALAVKENGIYLTAQLAEAVTPVRWRWFSYIGGVSLHGIIHCHAGRNSTAGRVNVQKNVLFGKYRFQKTEARRKPVTKTPSLTSPVGKIILSFQQAQKHLSHSGGANEEKAGQWFVFVPDPGFGHLYSSTTWQASFFLDHYILH